MLPALTPEKFEHQRDVVLNERRQSYENRPYGMVGMATMAALYPPDHPYHWTTIGSAADLRAAEYDDIRSFFRMFYHPGNASLTLAGDIEASEGIALAKRYFEDIPAGAPVSRVTVEEPTLPADTRLVLEDRVERPTVVSGLACAASVRAG